MDTLSDIESFTIVDAYKALADESRLRILSALDQSVFTVQELTQILGLSQSTVSHHLKVLNQSGIVEAERNGTFAFYRLSSKANPGHSLAKHFISLTKEDLANGLISKLQNDKSKIQNIIFQKRDSLKHLFDAAATEWQTVKEKIQGSATYYKEVLSFIKREDTLLEIGCGAGLFLDSALPRPGATIAVDYSEAMLTATQKTLGIRSKDVDLRLGYLEHLPVADEVIDSCVSYMVLHHIRDPKLVLKDVLRTLKPGGSICIIELSKYDPSLTPERAFADIWPGFDPKELGSWLVDIGFEEIKVTLLEDKEPKSTGTKPFLLFGIKPQTKEKIKRNKK